MTFADAELHVIWAAMWAMVDDFHGAQDNLTEEQWKVAADIKRRVDDRVNELAGAR